MGEGGHGERVAGSVPSPNLPPLLCAGQHLLPPQGGATSHINGLKGTKGFPGDLKWGPGTGPQVCFYQCTQRSGLCWCGLVFVCVWRKGLTCLQNCVCRGGVPVGAESRQ